DVGGPGRRLHLGLRETLKEAPRLRQPQTGRRGGTWVDRAWHRGKRTTCLYNFAIGASVVERRRRPLRGDRPLPARRDRLGEPGNPAPLRVRAVRTVRRLP